MGQQKLQLTASLKADLMLLEVTVSQFVEGLFIDIQPEVFQTASGVSAAAIVAHSEEYCLTAAAAMLLEEAHPTARTEGKTSTLAVVEANSVVAGTGACADVDSAAISAAGAPLHCLTAAAAMQLEEVHTEAHTDAQTEASSKEISELVITLVAACEQPSATPENFADLVALCIHAFGLDE